jgi:antitoxin HigA-1
VVRIPTHGPPTHPGEMLRAEFLEPLGLTQTAAAERLGIPLNRLNEIVRGKRGVTPDTALRLERLLGMEAAFWLNLQLGWDLYHAMRAPAAAEIRRIRPVRRAASTRASGGARGEA